jgi:hypothetical protein
MRFVNIDLIIYICALVIGRVMFREHGSPFENILDEQRPVNNLTIDIESIVYCSVFVSLYYFSVLTSLLRFFTGDVSYNVSLCDTYYVIRAISFCLYVKEYYYFL